MPWIKQEMCTGCRLCILECPVEAIALDANGVAEINDAKCIRCGRCHSACPQEAVRHDSERIPEEVADNLRWVRKLMDHFQTPTEQTAFIQRMTRFFNKQKKVSEQTLAAIAATGASPLDGIDAAIRNLSKESNTNPSKEPSDT